MATNPTCCYIKKDILGKRCEMKFLEEVTICTQENMISLDSGFYSDHILELFRNFKNN